MDCNRFILLLKEKICIRRNNRRNNEVRSVIEQVDKPMTFQEEQSEESITSHEVSNELYSSKENNEISPIKIIVKPKHTRFCKNSYEYDTVTIYEDVYKLYDHFYIAVFDGNFIFFINDNNTKFPLSGWFQTCIKCATITGQLYKYGYFHNKLFYVRMCEKCCNFFDKRPYSKINIKISNNIKDGLKYIKI